MKIDLILDRIENGIAVFTDSECKVYECSAEILPPNLNEGASLSAEVDSAGKLSSLTLRENPNAGHNRRRLMALFEKNIKNQKNLERFNNK